MCCGDCNNTLCQIASIERVRINTFDGIIRTLDEVRHVPYLKRVLIFSSTLNSKGYKYTGERRVLEANKGARVLLKRQKRFQLYVLQGSTESLETNQ